MSAGGKREDSKKYLADHKIPQIFESLLGCLMMERPENPVEFIERKMKEIKEIGADNVDWETLVQHLHPYRNDVRRQFIRDGSLFDQEFTKLQGEIDDYNKRKTDHFEALANTAYTPELFSLTEAHSWQWLWAGLVKNKEPVASDGQIDPADPPTPVSDPLQGSERHESEKQESEKQGSVVQGSEVASSHKTARSEVSQAGSGYKVVNKRVEEDYQI